MESRDESPILKSNHKTLFKNNSTNNFGSTFLYNLKYLRNDLMKKTITPKKDNINNIRFKSAKKKLLFLPDEQLFFSQIKNKQVRNFYETILKNSCRVKELKTKHLKNIFRIKNSNNVLLKSNQKEAENIFDLHNNNNKEKKSRTSNNLPFIQFSQNNNNNNYSINNIQDNNSNSIDIEIKRSVDNTKKNTKATIPSLFLKKSREKNKIRNSSYKIKINPISSNYKNNMNSRNKFFRENLNILENKGIKSVDFKSSKKNNNNGKIDDYKISNFIS